MGIVFGALEAGETSGNTNVGLLLSIDARAEALLAGQADVLLNFLMHVDADLAEFSDVVVPALPASVDVEFALYMDATGFEAITSFIETDVEFALSVEALPPNYCEVTFQLSVDATAAIVPQAYGFMVPQPPVMVGYAGLQFANINEQLAIGAAHIPLPIGVLREALGARARQTTTVDVMQAITEAVSFGELLAGLQYLLIEEGVAFGTSTVATPTQIARIIERLILSGAVTTYVEAIETITVGLAFGTLTAMMPVGTAEDSIVLDATIVDTVTAMAKLVESLVLQAEVTGVGTFVAVVREELVFSAGHGAGTTVDIAAVIREAVSFVARLTIDNGEYIAWVLNTESRGLSRYTNFPFNSFAKIGGKYFAADSTGLHRMQGDTDSGEVIKARIRLGLSDMGTRKLKRIPEAFIAYSGGSVFLKVITVAEDGEKEACLYRMKDRPAGAMRENRVPIGRGLKAIDWDFELESVDGTAIDFKALQFRPLILDRRTRG